jgi:hypothetical protein
LGAFAPFFLNKLGEKLMLNQATLKTRIDSLQCHLSGENLNAIGYCSIEFRSRSETITTQIEFHSQGNAAYALQEAGKGAVGVAMGSVEIYAPVPKQGQLNHRTILRIANFVALNASVATPPPAQRQQPRQQRSTRQQQSMPPMPPIPVQQQQAPVQQQQAPVPPMPVAAYSPPPVKWENNTIPI